MVTYQNPIIRGFNPDPSICRVGDDFYLVTSTFEYFPGVPIYHSRNLVNWHMIGHCLTSESQDPLSGCGASGGIYAPTIRYYNNTFFMTTTNVSSIRNFIVYTKDIKGGWSEPVLVNQTGIDPSLFFDDDGNVYYSSTAYDPQGRPCIQMSIINPFTGEQHSQPRIITHGCGGSYPEGAHIYKKDGFYYLLLAEGGTEYGHHATVQRSTCIWGPYENSPHNPLLYHQPLLGKTSIQSVGHADFIQDQGGQWWTVCLGIRVVSYGLLHNLGREVFLAPMHWDEEGWPQISEDGTIQRTMQANLPQPVEEPTQRFFDDFDCDTLHPQWTFLRNPDADCVSLTQKPSCLTLRGQYPLSTPNVSPGFVAIRQQEHAMRASTVLLGDLVDGQKAGICAYYGSNYHYEIFLCREHGHYAIAVNRRIHDLEKEEIYEEIEYRGEILLQIESDERAYHFAWQLPGAPLTSAGQGAVAGLCTEGTNGITFTGTFIGMFSEGGCASFDRFEMENLTVQKATVTPDS